MAEIYLQATGSTAGAVGLIAILFLATFPTLIGTFTTGGRMWWSLARDNATPFGKFFSHVDTKHNNPIRATMGMSVIVTCLGCIYVGSTTAFQALISSFIVLSSLSYAGAILPHVLTGRKNIVPGTFHLGRIPGFIINIVSLIYIAVTVVFFCFPFVLPATAQNMNYTSVITVGLMTLVGLWWMLHARKSYEGPKYIMEVAEKLAVVHEDSDSVQKQTALQDIVGHPPTSAAGSGSGSGSEGEESTAVDTSDKYTDKN